jgi:hypothetical protein
MPELLRLLFSALAFRIARFFLMMGVSAKGNIMRMTFSSSTTAEPCVRFFPTVSGRAVSMLGDRSLSGFCRPRFGEAATSTLLSSFESRLLFRVVLSGTSRSGVDGSLRRVFFWTFWTFSVVSLVGALSDMSLVTIVVGGTTSDTVCAAVWSAASASLVAFFRLPLVKAKPSDSSSYTIAKSGRTPRQSSVLYLPFCFLLPFDLPAMFDCFVLPAVAALAPLALDFLLGGSSSPISSCDNRALRLFCAPALFITMVSSGDRVRTMDISRISPNAGRDGVVAISWNLYWLVAGSQRGQGVRRADWRVDGSSDAW